jgi:hypothetical protein
MIGLIGELVRASKITELLLYVQREVQEGKLRALPVGEACITPL